MLPLGAFLLRGGRLEERVQRPLQVILHKGLDAVDVPGHNADTRAPVPFLTYVGVCVGRG